MFRFTARVACIVSTLALVGCGHGNALSATAAAAQAAQAQSLLHLHIPGNRLLAATEQNAGFDQGLAIGLQNAKGWDKTSSLFYAYHTAARPSWAGSKVPPKFFFAFNAGIDTLIAMISPETLVFHRSTDLLQRIFVGNVDTTKLVSGAQALAAAKATGLVRTDDPNVLLIRYRTMKDAAYTFTDSAAAAPADPAAAPQAIKSVVVDAYTGKVVTDKNVAAESTDTESQIAQESDTDAQGSMAAQPTSIVPTTTSAAPQ